MRISRSIGDLYLLDAIDTKSSYGKPDFASPTDKDKINYSWRKAWSGISFKEADKSNLTVLLDHGVVENHIAYRYAVTTDNSFLSKITKDELSNVIKLA